MAADTNITALEILKPVQEFTLTDNTLASLIDRHRRAFDLFNEHCAVLAEYNRSDPAEDRANRKLGRKERAARNEFLQHRPCSMSEVRAKAVYALLGDVFTDADRDSLLRSLI